MAQQPATALDTPTDLPSKNVGTAADALNTSLADLYALYLKTKNFHWHLSITDAVAERIRKTGNTTLRSIGDVSRHQTIKDNDKAFVAPEAMLAELRDDNLALIQQFRETRAKVEEANDTATSSMLDEWVDQAEERAWFLFEAARKG